MLRSFFKNLIAVISFSIIVLSAGYSFSLPADDIETINDRSYFNRVHKLFLDAKKSIYVIMFSANYYDKYPDSPSNILIRDLVAAKQRGVDVRVILEQDYPESGGFFGKKKIYPEKHQRVVEILEKYKIPYKLDSPDISTHAKLLIIDDICVVIGSTNWSYSAIEKNHETSVVIKSAPVAKSYISYFNNIYQEN